MSVEPLLAVQDVVAGYDRRRDVLAGVSLEVPRGRVTALVGENGSGKTTLLRVVLGLLRPRTGQVLFAGGERPRLGYVPQLDSSESLFPVTAAEVVTMGLTPTLPLLRRPGPRERAAVASALERLGVAALAERPFRSLSGGQRQRVLLARGIVADPGLLVLDEPVRGLDIASSAVLVAHLSRFAREQGMTILVATHSLDLVANHADHVALFRDGRVTSGPAAAVMTDEILEAHLGQAVRVRIVDGQRVVLTPLPD